MDSLQETGKRPNLAATGNKPFEPGINSYGKQDLASKFQLRTPTGYPSASLPVRQQNLWQDFARPSWLFRALVFAIRIPFVSADSGEDFSNNLIADLAPILSLFGEQVTRQSQWMRAAVGRAQEGSGIVEMELMSSTSPDVCEMWNGERVVRVLGSSSVAQLFYLVPESMQSGNTQIANDPQSTDGKNGVSDSLLNSSIGIGDKIYDLKSAATYATPLLRSRKENSGNTTLNPELNLGPNLALNLGGHIVSVWELYTIAIFTSGEMLV